MIVYIFNYNYNNKRFLKTFAFKKSYKSQFLKITEIY